MLPCPLVTVAIAMEAQQHVCSLCSSFAAPTFEGVLRHIGAEHIFDSNFHLQCGLDGCPRTFHNYSSWRSHIYRNHRKHMQRKAGENQLETFEDTNNPTADVNDNTSYTYTALIIFRPLMTI